MASADTTFLDPKGPVALAERTQFYHIILLMMIVVLPVLVFTPLIVWRFRYRRTGSRYAPKWKFWWPLEVLIWGVPFVVVAILSVWLWQGTTRLDPYRKLASDAPPLRVDVIGYDWKWLFVYPDLGIASIGRLELPANRPVAMRLTSGTVMQSFFIPALGSQIYVMAGMVTKLHLQADRPGRFMGENTQYNGDGFHKQHFVAKAVTPEGFRAWVANTKAHGIDFTQAVFDSIKAKGTTEKLRAALRQSGPSGTALDFRNVPSALLANIDRSFHGGSGTTVALLDHSPGKD